MRVMLSIQSALLVLFVLLSGCSTNTSTSQNIVYENAVHKFKIELPATWAEKYEIIETESRVVFVNKANKEAAGGELFQIEVWTQEKWKAEGEELAQIIRLTKLAEADGEVYTFRTPTDVQYTTTDESLKKAYNDMFQDVEKIKDTFQLIK